VNRIAWIGSLHCLGREHDPATQTGAAAVQRTSRERQATAPRKRNERGITMLSPREYEKLCMLAADHAFRVISLVTESLEKTSRRCI
jgi:hypothetical protein